MTPADSASLTAEEFGRLFDTFTSTAVRLETLPSFQVGGAEAERLAAFRAGRSRPLRSVRTDPWLARIAVTTVQGKRWSRVRILDDPLTEYERYQIASHIEAQACGEEIVVVRRADAPESVDVWLFDETTAVVMHYRDDGTLDRREFVTDSGQVRRYAAAVAGAAAKAVGLNEFLAVADG